MSTSTVDPNRVHKYEARLIYDTANTPRANGTILPIPREVVKLIPVRSDRTRRVNVDVAPVPVYQAKVQGNGRGGYFVPVNKQRVETLERAFGKKKTVEVKLSADLSKYGLPVPPVFELLLYEDPEAEAYFDALPGGKQRRVLFGIGASPREATRLHRAVQTIEYLKQVRGEVSMKALSKTWRLPKVDLN